MPRYLIFLLLLGTALAQGDALRQGQDPQSGLKSWTLRAPPVQIELIQRLPDQTRGFFLARGFPRRVADDIATHCVLQAIGRNVAPPGHGPVFVIDLSDWRIRLPGERRLRPIKLKSDWLAQWRDDPAVSRAARIAFRWATFPTRQTYRPTDYNWGMISFGPPPGTVFDLQVAWRVDGRVVRRWIEGVECPPDRDVPPAE